MNARQASTHMPLVLMVLENGVVATVVIVAIVVIPVARVDHRARGDHIAHSGYGDVVTMVAVPFRHWQRQVVGGNNGGHMVEALIVGAKMECVFFSREGPGGEETQVGPKEP
eukprot:8102956-Lingulodinium_polyedra.AAC.1